MASVKPDKDVNKKDNEIRYAIDDRAKTIGKCNCVLIYPTYSKLNENNQLIDNNNNNNNNSNNNNNANSNNNNNNNLGTSKLFFWDICQLNDYDQWLSKPINIKNMSNYMKTIMLLRGTRNHKNVILIQNIINQNNIIFEKCNKVLKAIMSRCDEYHLPYLLGMLYWQADYTKVKNNSKNAISDNDKKIKNHKLQTKIQFLSLNAIPYGVINNDTGNKSIYHIPNYYVPYTVVQYFCDKLALPYIDMNNNKHNMNNIREYCIINLPKYYKTGYQSIAQIRCSFYYTFEIYKYQCWQHFNEKIGNDNSEKALYHSKKIDDMQLTEMYAPVLMTYLKNQTIAETTIGQPGSMINEFLHRYCNSADLQYGLKNCVSTFKLLILIQISYNYRYIKSLLKNKKKKKHLSKFTSNEINDMKNIIDEARQDIKYEYKHNINNKNNKILNNIKLCDIDYKDKLNELAFKWLQIQKVEPGKAKWDNRKHGSVLTLAIYWLGGTLKSSMKDTLVTKIFNNIFSWKQIVFAAKRNLNVYLDDNINHPIYFEDN